MPAAPWWSQGLLICLAHVILVAGWRYFKHGLGLKVMEVINHKEVGFKKKKQNKTTFQNAAADPWHHTVILRVTQTKDLSASVVV